MDQNELSDLLKYSSPYSILVVTGGNRLIEIYCPFKVLVINEIGEFQRGEITWVSRIKVTFVGTTVYIVKSKPYYYYHFDIINE